MKTHPRRIESLISKDLKKKMVLLSGPRQCGKTTLSKHLPDHVYYNWDIFEHRKKLLQSKLDPSASLWILDEIHKNRKWRNWLKGIYDEHCDSHQILVTGSARLDLYSRGGDSLQGRYFQHRLHPFTLTELSKLPYEKTDWESTKFPKNLSQVEANLQKLLVRGGFPEPLFSDSETDAARWRIQYGQRLIQEEVTSLEQVQDLARMELLFDQLANTVGSVLSINSLREDLDVSFGAVKKWIEILEKLYGVFRIYPFGSAKLKAVKKEAKLYFWDWARVEKESARFENLVAVHLLRWVHWQQDILGQKYDLRYFRSTVGHEVDFLILKNSKPLVAIEVKTDERPVDSGIKYFLERTPVPHSFQIHLHDSSPSYGPKFPGGHLRFLSALRFLSMMP